MFGSRERFKVTRLPQRSSREWGLASPAPLKAVSKPSVEAKKAGIQISG
jgi:hypothetical protein